MATAVEELRGFNRFYTQQIGLLSEGLTGSPFSLAEARVLYELASGAVETAADLSRALSMDKAHLSRILARFKSQGLIVSVVSPRHAKQRLLSLTDAGREAFAGLNRGSAAQMAGLLSPLGRAEKERLIEAMRAVRSILGKSAAADGGFILRPPRIGELGWVVHRQAALYATEYGWDWIFEGLISGIIARFVADFDPLREAAWVAEHQGEVAGSIFLMRGEDPSCAKLRLLYVEPSARGLGVGAALVAACVDRARAIGYRALTLWTNDILVSARRLYQAAGFQLIAEDRHHSFGHDLVGQTWRLELGS